MLSNPLILPLAHACVTWFLVGLIWTIQVVHYPLFALVGGEGYAAFQRSHMNRITWIVGPAMVCELGLAAWLVLAPGAVPLSLAVVGLALVIAIWVSTAVAQGPMHARLVDGFDAALHRALVRTNWVRTIAWTARGGIAAAMVASAMGARS
jgi:hypothetical protein